MQIGKAIIEGHSFGALLTLFLAAHYPERIDKMILMDAAARMHENTKEMLAPALSRLGQAFPSFETYLEKVKSAPYIDFWDEKMLSYYAADVRKDEDGTVLCMPQPAHMIAAVDGVMAESMRNYIASATHAALLINGPGIYTMGAALLPKENV